MAELSMWIGWKSFCIVYHTLNGFIWTISGRMININALQLNIKGTDVLGIKANNILSNNINFIFFPLFFFSLFSSLFHTRVGYFNTL